MRESRAQNKKRHYAQLLDDDSIPSGQSTEPLLVSPEPDRLCARCRKIDLDAIFQMKVEGRVGSFIVDLGASIEELKASHCDMCQLFGSASPSDFSKDRSARSERCHLRAFSANRVFARLAGPEMRLIHDLTLLGVVRVKISDANTGKNNAFDLLNDCLQETGYLCSVQPNQRQSILGIRRLSIKSFDLKFATDCLKYCLASHHVVCSAIKSFPSELMGLLRVIDCHTRTITRAPAECQYVALSYVWGYPTSPTTSTDDQNIHRSLQNAPKVIGDAIDVTLKLHLRYLWVDRYCIDQLNKEDKHNQIRLMDLIYASARLTIIAAAGENPHYGLPGVRGTLRNLQPSLKLGTHCIVSTLPHPSWSVRNSKWASRGWTYQEGLLSKRRLIFTNEQVFYECNGMHCAESLLLPLDELHIKSKKAFKANIPLGAFMHKTPGKKPWDVMKYVAEFNKRDLTFPEDAVNAMQGIFNSFSNSPRPVHQFVGVPILPPKAALRYHTVYKPTARTPEECFLIGLSWFHHGAGGIRRPAFPSWSWAGWVGDLCPLLMFPKDSISRLNNVNVWIEDDDGSLLRFPEWPENLQPFLSSRDHCKNRFLHIEAITIRLSFVYLQKDTLFPVRQGREPRESRRITTSEYYAKIKTGMDTFVYASVRLDEREQDFQQKFRVERDFTGILVGEPGTGGFVLVVHEMAMDKYAERIGCFHLGAPGCYWYDDDSLSGWLPNEKVLKRLEKMPQVRQKIRLG